MADRRGDVTALQLKNDLLTACVSSRGAELVGLDHRDHGPLLWHGDGRWWDRVSPILFPAVGRSVDDRVLFGIGRHQMPLHGFAHTAEFDIVDADDSACRLTLADSIATRRHYPFAFRLDLAYRIDGARIAVQAGVVNSGDVPLPFQFGFHPGLRWPLAPGRAKAAHWLDFDADADLDVQRARDGYILTEQVRQPLAAGRLMLDEALFRDGAMVLAAPQSRRLRYGVPGLPFALEVSHDLPSLGLWSKPGANFLCIEPWHGHGDPAGFDGDFQAKPGVMVLQPAERRGFAMSIGVVAADPS